MVRNRYLPERAFLSALCPVPVPKIWDRCVAGVVFHSIEVPPYARKSQTVAATLHSKYLQVPSPAASERPKVRDSLRESKSSWLEALQDFPPHGLQTILRLVIGDGTIELWSIRTDSHPQTGRRHTWVAKPRETSELTGRVFASVDLTNSCLESPQIHPTNRRACRVETAKPFIGALLSLEFRRTPHRERHLTM